MSRSRIPLVPPHLTMAERKLFLRERFPHRITVPFDKIEEAERWCSQNCAEDWHNFNGATGFHFASSADAIMLKFVIDPAS